MLKEQEALLESLSTTHNKKRNRVAAAQDVSAESSPCELGCVPACSQFPIERIAEVAQIWKAVADRRKAFEGDASCFENSEGATAAVVVISPNKEQ
jgi:cell wall assembly regulator SMI1